jgi:ribosomal protein L27
VTALTGGTRQRVQPGDTVWLRGGTYSAVRSTVTGREGAPVVIRPFDHERAILDGRGSHNSTLYVAGDYTVFWGLEVTNSDPQRTTTSLGSDFRPGSVVASASHVKFVNLIVHDGGVAFYTEPKFSDIEISGCIIYNNGWQGPDRGHGHGLYLKSYTGPLVARDNVIFNQYGYGVHAYTNAGTGKLINITVEGNVTFDNGTLADRSMSSNILFGGADYAAGDVIRGNVAYYAPSARTGGGAGPNVTIGWRTTQNGDVIVEDNYIVGGMPPLEFGFWKAARVTHNTLIGLNGGERLIEQHASASAEQIWRDNAEHGAPATTKIVVRPNSYEKGRATVVVFNWGDDTAVPVDIGGLLSPGDHYEVRNVQDLFGTPVARGTVTGNTITIPLGGVKPPVPVGRTASPAPRTGPAFDVFLVTRSTP